MIEFVDERVADICAAVDKNVYIKGLNSCEKFKRKISSYKLEDCAWHELRNIALATKGMKYAFLFLMEMLERNLYDDHKYIEKKKSSSAINEDNNDYQDYLSQNDKLYELFPTLKKHFTLDSSHKYYSALFNIPDLTNAEIIPHFKGSQRISIIEIKNLSSTTKELMHKFIPEVPNSCSIIDNPNFKKAFIYNFEYSLEGMQIKCVSDYTAKTFWHQLKYYKENYKSFDNVYAVVVKSLCHFYKWLLSAYDLPDFFKNEIQLTSTLLYNWKFPTLIIKEYYFTTFSPNKQWDEPHDKICFNIINMNDTTTHFNSQEEVLSLDCSKIKTPEYRIAFWNYMQNLYSIFSEFMVCYPYIINVFSFLDELKSQDSYPNPDLFNFTQEEAMLIKKFFDDSELKLATKNNRIGAVRRLFIWLKDTKQATFDDEFFIYLMQYAEPAKTTAHSIPNEDLKQLNSYLLEKSKESIKDLCVYVAFHLAIQTEFRMGTICSLRIDCIKSTLKSDQYCITTTSKTSHGEKETYVITKNTYQILQMLIDKTEKYRSCCVNESIKSNLFIKENYAKKIVPLGRYDVTKALKAACNALNIEEYTSANLRDTHMTKAFEFVLRNNKSKLELSVLSKHKQIDTTKKHYVDMELEEMLECTFGITIGEDIVDAQSKVVDEIPSDINTTDSDVEKGCGKCSATVCDVVSSLPCFCCKYFITTPKHEEYFNKQITLINDRIQKTSNGHDKEDLTTIKRLYVLFLQAILKHKPGG